MVEIGKLQEKLGEVLGLEIAAQKAVEELGSKGLLDEDGMLTQLQKMQTQAGNHQSKLENTIKNLTELDGSELDSTKIQEVSQETAEKCSKMMETYLGDDPDSSEAIEFLCLAEGGEVTHYEVVAAMAKGLKGKMNNKQFITTVNSILREEKRHLALCTRLAKQAAK